MNRLMKLWNLITAVNRILRLLVRACAVTVCNSNYICLQARSRRLLTAQGSEVAQFAAAGIDVVLARHRWHILWWCWDVGTVLSDVRAECRELTLSASVNISLLCLL